MGRLMGRPQEWLPETIQDACRDFVDENGKFPTAADMNRTPWMPSETAVRRYFGNLTGLHDTFGLPTAYGSTKLTERNDQIAQRRKDGMTYDELAQEFNISSTRVREIIDLYYPEIARMKKGGAT